MVQPKISILMLTYNRPQMIGRAIASAVAQTFGDWELIIVQDGENPETEARLREWLEKEPRIRYFPRGTVGSIAEASNYGLEKARGEYIAILDDDDYWAAEDKLARQAQFLDTNAEYVGCAGGYIMVDGSGRERGRFIKPIEDREIRARALLANPIANSASMFRRMVGGAPAMYDAGLRQFADWDFWLTMGSKGKLYNFPEYLAYYALWDGGSSFKHQKGNARAAIQLIFKHKAAYRGFPAALTLAYLYWCYAQLPAGVKRVSYEGLSALKKAITGVSKSTASA